ncbi:MAG: DUF3488 domain-containing protein [Pirellulales bacterium]|nr:DUF3488 domain-containing protein [Pirellulales bacterium]
MSYPRLLPILTATLAVLSTMLLGLGQLLGVGQGGAGLPLLVFAAAVLSVWLTDLAGWFRLHRMVAGGMALIAFVIAMVEAWPLASVMSILPIARLLVYIQIILLFQAKHIRLHWQLVTVSLLQVLVAAIFNQGALFGLLMVAYLFVALAAMTLLFLSREASAFTPPPAESAPTATSGRRWPLADLRPAFVGASPRRTVGSRAGPELARRIASMGVATLCLTAVAFFLLPRLGRPAWRGLTVQPRRMVGYSGRVELGSLGAVIQSPQEVARVELTDPATGEIVRLDEAIYLHGTVLTEYRDRAWSYPHAERLRGVPATEGPPIVGAVRQRITMEPTDHREIFYARPMVAARPRGAAEKEPGLQFDRRSERLLRDEELCAKRSEHVVETSSIVVTKQKPLVPAAARPNLAALCELPREAVPTVALRAEQWLTRANIPPERRLDRARHLEYQLRDTGQFTYNLRAARQDFEIDPIEDFVANRPEGHCEYFATALALMLRGQGIPSRLVVGYCCDEYNPLGRFYQVRQLHAHTWVEVYLEPDQLPGNMGQDPIWSRGGWFRLDATPSASDRPTGVVGAVLAPVGRGVSWLEYLWNNYVMEMDRSRQRRAIYEPLVEAVKDAYRRATDPVFWRELGDGILRAINPRNWNVSQWFSWRGGLATFLIGVLLVLIYRACRLLVRAAQGWIRRLRRRTTAARVEVEFYRRLGRVLARAGIVRRPNQTPREFAALAGQRIAPPREDPDVGGLPARIVEAFYQVRFGREPLDNQAALAVEQALVRLEAALVPTKRR